MELITLVDNLVYGEGLTGEHGSSFLIKTKGKTILFDTGQTNAFINNAAYLAEDLSEVDFVILSHGHYDHCGGLEAFLALNQTATIYLKSKAFGEKIAIKDDIQHFIGFKLKKPIQDYPNTFVLLDEDTLIEEGIKIITDIPMYTNDLVDTSKFFVKDTMRLVQDPFADELILLITEDHKNFLFTGCSHKGILNILKTAYEKNNHKNLHYVFGGMHFSGELLRHLDQYLMQFTHFGIERIFVNHCTGIEGYFRLKIKFPQKVSYAFTGFHVEL